MKALLCTTAAFLALSAGAALAQSTPDWTGPHVGVSFGAAAVGSDDDETILFDKDLNGSFADTVTTVAGANAFSPGFCNGAARGPTPAAGCREDDRSFDRGLRLGYDQQIGSLVLGGVVEYSKPDVEDSVSAFSTTPAFYTMEREVDGMLAARVRAGYALGRFLPYVTAGVAKAEIENKYFTSNSVNSQALRGGEDADGYQLGFGGEVMIAPRFSLGLEYLYTSLENEDARVRVGGPVAATNPFILSNPSGTDFRRSDEEFQFNSVRLTGTFRF